MFDSKQTIDVNSGVEIEVLLRSIGGRMDRKELHSIDQNSTCLWRQ